MARWKARSIGRLCGVAEAMGKEGSSRPTLDEIYCENLGCRQQDLRTRARRALRSRSRGAGKDGQQCAIHDARKNCGYATRIPDQGGDRLWSIQVCKGRMEARRSRIPSK